MTENQPKTDVPIQSPRGLAELEAHLARDMAWLNLPPKAWMPERKVDGTRVLDVAILGAGLCGLTAAAALRHLGIYQVRLFDSAPRGREGPWVTYARMETLRTAKEATGPALGVPSLTFRAWFEAQYGAYAWERMDLAPRDMWMDYLIWYRRVTQANVLNDCGVSGIVPRQDGLLALDTSQGRFLARRVVLATGLDGLGAPYLPDIAQTVPSRFVRHSADPIDMAALRNRRVAVVGSGASAMDNAAAALEAGAARVDILVRRSDVPRVDKFTGVGSKGMTHGYIGLPDEIKWALMNEGDRAPVPPPRHSMLRVFAHANAHLHTSSPIKALRQTESGVAIKTPSANHEVDLVIFATGFGIDLSRRPELEAFAPHIMTWGDRMPSDRATENPRLAAHPYLAEDFSFIENESGACPALSQIHCFAFAAIPSHGKLTSGIPAASDGADRLSKGILRAFFAEDAQLHLDRFRAFNDPEILGNEWPAPNPA